MTTLIHHSPLGALVIGGVVGEIEPGDPFDVDDELAGELLEQSELFELAPTAADRPHRGLTVAQLRELAEQRGVNIDGLRSRADLRAALDAAASNDTDPTTADTTDTAGGEQ